MKQFTYSTLFGIICESAEAAKSARDAKYRELKAEGKKVTRSVLKNQLKKYAAFGLPDGRSCDCYELTVWGL